MSLPIDVWREQVSAHLDKIEAGCAMAERHTKALMIRPDFETRAWVELDLCAKALLAALERIERAKAIYAAKEIGE